MSKPAEWSVEVSKQLYGLEHSIRGEYLTIDETGALVLKIGDESVRIIDLMKKYGFETAYIRFLPAIKSTMKKVFETFKTLSQIHGYTGKFQPVFPMKVNPIPLVIDAIWRYGEEFNWGFNSGSIGELRLLHRYLDKGSRLLIYDGVVSDNVLKLLMDFKKAGWHVIVDVESEHDLQVLSKYGEINVGIRVKPFYKPGGKWSHSAGLEGKFGLTINTLLKLIKEYKWLNERAILIHIHGGSQIYELKHIAAIFDEARILFNDLRSIGFENISIIDTGGGMAYPYHDSRKGTPESPNYTIVDYLNLLIRKFNDVHPHPTLVFEGGRYIVASHRIVVAKVVDVRPYSTEYKPFETGNGERLIGIPESLEGIKKILQYTRDIQSKIKGKTLTLAERERVEDIITHYREEIIVKLAEIIRSNPSSVENIINDPLLYKILTSPSRRFIVNLSLFADIPDSVLVNQYFQVTPIQKLNEKPDVLAVLGDLTCDSMGELREFISDVEIETSVDSWFNRMDFRISHLPKKYLKLGGIPLHLPGKDEDYYLAFLDTGAYQDPLAMKHNLIYGAPEIVIDINGSGKPVIKVLKHGRKSYL
ncbi:decarboxylase [Thermosphaera chiliense]|uniref:arginine decarboxylase n=1 Tax=Thermosphaera chiliense TaxID=3402707 RepID=A0A7M1URD1_9CREN|nr:decarboxylase [Thermosphaera aggregans]QOR94013.1 decarboxylase [Thermosphaera aggregans]